MPDLAATDAIGRRIATSLRVGDVITLEGALGAGKTSLARAILAGLGLQGEAPSPSFAIVQPYGPPEVRLPVCHVDLYRLGDPVELEELGLEDAEAVGALIVEWPDRAGIGRWPEALALRIEALDAGERPDARRLTASAPAAWKDRWPT